MSAALIVDVDWMNPKHGQDLVDMLEVYATDLMGGGQGLLPTTKANLFESLGRLGTCHAILAYVDEESAGLLISFEGFSTFACKPLLNLHDIVVSSPFRGRGISKMLMNRAEEIARELGCCKMTLEVLSGNKVAQSAYAAFGFEGYQLDAEQGTALFWQKKIS
jgi:GNAT superfamily N-acetyltransferase